MQSHCLPFVILRQIDFRRGHIIRTSFCEQLASFHLSSGNGVRKQALTDSPMQSSWGQVTWLSCENRDCLLGLEVGRA